MICETADCKALAVFRVWPGGALLCRDHAEAVAVWVVKAERLEDRAEGASDGDGAIVAKVPR